jgi:hypothetical protein
MHRSERYSRDFGLFLRRKVPRAPRRISALPVFVDILQSINRGIGTVESVLHRLACESAKSVESRVTENELLIYA